MEAVRNDLIRATETQGFKSVYKAQSKDWRPTKDEKGTQYSKETGRALTGDGEELQYKELNGRIDRSRSL